MPPKTKEKSNIPLLPPIAIVIKETEENRTSLKEKRLKELEKEINKFNNLVLVQMGKAIKAGYDSCSEYIGDSVIADALLERYRSESYEANYSIVAGILTIKWTKQ